MRTGLRGMIVVALLCWGAAHAQEVWSGVWATTGGNEGGKMNFTLQDNGLLAGTVTNGGVTGVWRGFFMDNGTLFAYYNYPFFTTSQAMIIFTKQQGNLVSGYMVVWAGTKLAGDGQVTLERSAALGRPLSKWPFTGTGKAVYCAVGASCPKRSFEDVPGDWGGLFIALRQGNLPGACQAVPAACKP